MVGQSVPPVQCDGRGNRRAGPGVRGGADVVEGMMIHFCTDADYDVTLEKLAELLRPLLAQPAPAAVPAVLQPDWTTAPDWAQWWAMDEIGLAWWYEQKPECCRATWESTLGHYKEDTSAEQAKSYPAWRDSLAQRPQVADANFWRAAFEDAKRDADQLRERVAELEAIIDRRERQTSP